jgi:imidazole glycerol-phosphate synthase subunit HisH
MKVVIVKYNAGNIQSVLFALERLGIQGEVSDHFDAIKHADKVIFPGVGEASSAMAHLKERKLDTLIGSLQQPVLGICLGMQLLCQYSEEGNTPCMGIFNTHVKRFSSDVLKVPQVGWNAIFDLKSELFKGVENNAYQYFVHGYYAQKSEYGIATTHYELVYDSALHYKNFYGVQFHPEKSGKVGEQILKNFLDL